MTHGLDRELEIAVKAAAKAGDLAMRLQTGIEMETKKDLSPVTEADRACEKLIASILEEEFPGDGVMGEEGAARESKSGRRWILDPIDGTRDYARGNPLWANLVAMEAGGEVVLGVVNLPGLGLLFQAQKGGGALRNGVAIQPSTKQEVSESVLCFSGLSKVGRLPFAKDFLNWAGQFWAYRAFGGAMDAMLVASGQADVWIEAGAQPWDFAPLKVIAEEAGAAYFNLDGGSSIYAGNCVICAPGLKPEMMKVLQAADGPAAA